jgi:hypothetical protein
MAQRLGFGARQGPVDMSFDIKVYLRVQSSSLLTLLNRGVQFERLPSVLCLALL